MKTMQAVTFLTLGLLLVVSVACAQETQDKVAPAGPVWFTSLEKATVEAQKAGKPILMDFTGSDWCGWCIKLRKEVFDTQEFKDWAVKNVILLEVDFPQRKAQDDATKKQNQKLQSEYKVEGYPTIVFVTAAGKELGRSGYMRGGPKVWTDAADKIIAPKKPETAK